MNELERLLRRAAAIEAAGDRISLTFARELARVWRDAERALRRLVLSARPGSVSDAVRATQALLLQTQVRRLLEQAGYDRLIIEATTSGAERMITSVLTGRTLAEIARFRQSAQTTIDALRRIAAVDLFAQGDEVAVALWRSLAQHLFTIRPVSEIVADLADALDRSEADVQTLFDTQMQIFTRQVERMATEDLGPRQPYWYSHPIDDKTRPFCLEHAGKVYSRAAIDELDNGQLPNVFLTGGGYNCRGMWLAVESAELKALANTGERVGPAEEDVRRVRERRAQRRRAA